MHPVSAQTGALLEIYLTRKPHFRYDTGGFFAGEIKFKKARPVLQYMSIVGR